MRQIFTSPRLENVEGVAALLTEAGIEIKVTEGRGYKQISRREFSYVENRKGESEQPAIWVIKSEDYKRAREMLHDMGLVDATASSSYVPEALQFKQAPTRSPAARINRMRMVLLFVVGGMAAWMVIRMLLL